MIYKNLLSLLLALALTVCVGCSAPQDTQNTPSGEQTVETPPVAGSETGTGLGDRIADFTVTTYDGNTVTLSEVLKEKELVLINIWATWCGPCRMEFPFMEEAYNQYEDKVEIIALSGDPSDTDAMIGDLAAELGLTFPMGRDSADIATRFAVTAFPTTIAVDRFGTICMIEAGAQTSADNFRNLFDAFLGDWYTESIVLDGFPSMKPTAERLSDEVLSAALNAEGGSLDFTNDSNIFVWPMAVEDKDGRSTLATTNGGAEKSRSAVCLRVNAKAGEVLAFDFRLSSETGFDYLKLYVDGKVVKRFSGEKDWASYAHAFETDGEHSVKIVYQKDHTGNGGADKMWIDNFRVLSGDEAAAALRENPTYPVNGETSFRVANKNARKITVNDPSGTFRNFFGGNYEAYILFENEGKFTVTLAEGMDPEAAIAYNNNFEVCTMADAVSGNGYAFTCVVDSMETTGVGGSYVLFLPDAEKPELYPVLLFADEENATSFIAMNTGGSWEYDESEIGASDVAGEIAYTLKFVDQDGLPVSGVTAQVCDDSTCMVAVSDANGLCEMMLPPFAYEIHILKIPDGYEADTGAAYTASDDGGELVISLNRK